MRLIDADVFEKNLENEWRLQEISNNDLIQVREWLAQEQTVDAVPVRHGKWIPLQLSIAYPPYQCSCCFGNAPMVMVGTGRLKKGHLEALLTDFCPNCGARMDERKEE